MQEARLEGRRGGRALGNVIGIVIMLATLGVGCACALHVHAHGIGSWEGFLGLTLVTTFAQALFALQFDARFGRPTNGTSGQLGMAMIWFIVRAVAGIAIVACGLAGVCTYADAYLTVVIVCGICDAVLIITSR